jgi:multidrug efflux system outer membrane protein
MSMQAMKEARNSRESQVAGLRKAEELAVMRYRGGVSTYLEVVSAQQDRLLAELLLADVKGQQHQVVVRLYRTLGGGWNMHEKDQSAKSDPTQSGAPVPPGGPAQPGVPVPPGVPVQPAPAPTPG